MILFPGEILSAQSVVVNSELVWPESIGL